MITTGNLNTATRILSCIVNTDPVYTVSEDAVTVQTGNGSTFRIEHDPEEKMYSLFVIMKEKIMPTLGQVDYEVLLATRRTFRRACIEMAKWELYRSIRHNFKV